MLAHDKPPRGVPVLTIDGRRIGSFIQEAEGCYQVNVDGHSYWLPESALWQADHSAVVLICDHSGVSRYALTGPPPAA
jgi:hypothetical protein